MQKRKKEQDKKRAEIKEQKKRFISGLVKDLQDLSLDSMPFSDFFPQAIFLILFQKRGTILELGLSGWVVCTA